MRSVKPGRGPSAMGAVISAILVLFGIGWTIVVYDLTADFPSPFRTFLPLSGVLFVVVGLFMTYYHFTNATRKNRFSALEITHEDEEPDPLNQAYGRAAAATCSNCGATTQQSFDYCPKCGKPI